MLIIKLSMLNGNRLGKEMSLSEFEGVANRLWRIQHLASDINGGDLLIRMRPMIIQQTWYQGDILENLIPIARQFNIYVNGDEFYNNKFKELYGFSLRSFYLISIYLLLQVSFSGKGVLKLSISSMILFLCPKIPLKDLMSYFVLVGVRVYDLPDFFKLHKLKDDKNQQSEYFQPTPLRFKPLLIANDSVFIINRHVFSSGVASIVTDLLKKNFKEEFKVRFGPDMENYVGDLISASGLNFYRESDLKKIYAKNSLRGKVSDYLLLGGDKILLECKAIEPGDIVKSSFDSELIRRILTESFIHAIEQGQETAFLLSETRELKDEKFKLIVVTHEDFWFATGADVVNHVDPKIRERVVSKYGYVPIEFEDIIYVTVRALEALLELHCENDVDFFDCISKCLDLLKTPKGKRQTSFHAFTEITGGKFPGGKSIIKELENLQLEINEMYEENKKYWQADPLSIVKAEYSLMNSTNKRLAGIKFN